MAVCQQSGLAACASAWASRGLGGFLAVRAGRQPFAALNQPRPQSLSEFQVDFESPVGRGACSVVFAGKHRNTNFDVAVKAMSTTMTTETGALPVASGIRNESKAFDHLLEGPAHPHVVELVGRFSGLAGQISDLGLDAHEDQQVHYFVTELLSGGSLEDSLQQGVMPEATARRIIRRVCEGLASLHDQGIVHRDLKPGNVLFSEDEEEPKLIDFSHAGLVNGDEETLTGELGTRGFVAPEVLSERPYGKKCDVFSLGCTVHALLTGRPPRRQLRVGFVQQLPSSASPSAHRFVEALLTVDPRSRPSAREALAESWLQE